MFWNKVNIPPGPETVRAGLLALIPFQRKSRDFRDDAA
jgi:hypothetical protein